MARVLVIDDDSGMRELLQDILTASGHSVTTATDGNDALRLFSFPFVDAVITDILMPEKEGLETISELLSRHPALKIIAMSGAPPSWKVLEMAENLGALKTVTKPFSRQEIIDAVDKVLKTPPTQRG
jgi:DNA-binding NtrC family response regulator